MKELDNLKQEDVIEVVAEQQQKNTVVFIGSKVRVPGHILWQYNTVTKELVPATFAKSTYTVTTFDRKKNIEQLLRLNSRVNVLPNCVYFQALNRENALKRIAKENI